MKKIETVSRLTYLFASSNFDIITFRPSKEVLLALLIVIGLVGQSNATNYSFFLLNIL